MKDNKSHNSIRRILPAVVFIAIFIVLLIPLSYILRRGGDTKSRFMGFYAEPKDSLDIVMIGSSPTYSCCVMPELYGEYGIKAYPLASNVQRPIAGQFLVKEAEKTQSPDMYMFEMRMYVGLEVGLGGNMAYTREVTDNMKYSANRIDAINAMVTQHITTEDTDKYTYYFDIFKYHSNWGNLIDPVQLGSWRFTSPDPLKGYKITDKVGPAEPAPVPEDPIPMELDPYEEQALQDLLETLKETGAQALFYVSPYVLKDEDAEKYAHIRDEVEAAGYDWLDMNQYYDEIGLDFSRDFSDYGVHTNAVGAQKCTVFLGEYLRDHYDLTDHRTTDDSEQASGAVTGDDPSWDAAYTQWQSEYEAAVPVIDRRIETVDFFVYE
ncbi:MAG: SGNH/GDSL hydrolase family protein [Lachnospiraceae bacterium]|nr:SGNH/GDSL hydrolase family protein [Lachnospiraceae bacterium]